MSSTSTSREARYLLILTLLVLGTSAVGWVIAQLLQISPARATNYLYIGEIGGLLGAYLRERDR